MKKIIVMALLLTTALQYGQSGQERVMLQQLAALRSYASQLRKGYSLVKKGLAAIGRIQEGELGLHSIFYSGLESVSPAVRGYQKVGKLMELASRTARVCQSLENLAAGDLYYGDESDYILRVAARVRAKNEDVLGRLTNLLTPGELTLDDSGRLERIGQLYNEALDIFTFSEQYYQSLLSIAGNRAAAVNSISGLNHLYNLSDTP